jgi:hypothetical protein
MLSLNSNDSLHFACCGADVVPSVEETNRRPSTSGPFTTDAEFEKMIGMVGRTDLIGAAVKGIGGCLRLVHSGEDLPPMPQHLADLLRRAA